MSISLPNGTILQPPSQPQISAAVTRILHLTNFSPELKTRDLQLIFKEWDNDKGGYRIKWLDDVNALVVFADPVVAKRAYLSLLLRPPATFPPPATIRPYDQADAASIIAQLSARAMGHRTSTSTAPTPTNTNGISGLPESNSQGRAMSMSGLNGFVMPTSSSTSKSSTSNTNNNSHSRPGRGSIHARSGSASSTWSRGLGSTVGGGALNFPSSNSGRLPTHSESSADPSRSSSSEEDPVVNLESSTGSVGRRDSLSAEKAMREVEKALAHVEAQG